MSWQQLVNQHPFGERVWLQSCHAILVENENDLADVVILTNKEIMQSTKSDLYRLKILRRLCFDHFNQLVRHLYVLHDDPSLHALLDNNAKIIDVS